MLDVNEFDSMKIGIASPEKILEWSHGEVTKPETEVICPVITFAELNIMFR